MTRPQILRSAGILGAHSTSTTSKRLKATKRSRRLDFGTTWPYGATAWMAFNTALGLNAVQAFNDGAVSWGVGLGAVAGLSSAGCVFWAIRTALAGPEKPHGPTPEECERWRKLAFRHAFLKAEIARRKANHQAYRDLQEELREHTLTILVGRA